MFAKGPSSFDCSGLVLASWSAAGVNLPHNSVLQAQVLDNPFVTLVPFTVPNAKKTLPGDLLFYYDDWHHCGIYTDNETPGAWMRSVQATDPAHGVEHIRIGAYGPPLAIGWMGHR